MSLRSRAILRQLPMFAFSALLMVGVPLTAGLLALISGQGWSRLIGLPSLLIAAWMLFQSVEEVRERFGVRLVPQFDAPLKADPQTYFTGVQLLRCLGSLPELAACADQRWLSPAVGQAAVSASLSVSNMCELRAELAALSRALTFAETEGRSFRLVVVASTGMNGALWARLRAQGF